MYMLFKTRAKDVDKNVSQGSKCYHSSKMIVKLDFKLKWYLKNNIDLMYLRMCDIIIHIKFWWHHILNKKGYFKKGGFLRIKVTICGLQWVLSSNFLLWEICKKQCCTVKVVKEKISMFAIKKFSL